MDTPTLEAYKVACKEMYRGLRARCDMDEVAAAVRVLTATLQHTNKLKAALEAGQGPRPNDASVHATRKAMRALVDGCVARARQRDAQQTGKSHGKSRHVIRATHAVFVEAWRPPRARVPATVDYMLAEAVRCVTRPKLPLFQTAEAARYQELHAALPAATPKDTARAVDKLIRRILGYTYSRTFVPHDARGQLERWRSRTRAWRLPERLDPSDVVLQEANRARVVADANRQMSEGAARIRLRRCVFSRAVAEQVLALYGAVYGARVLDDLSDHIESVRATDESSDSDTPRPRKRARTDSGAHPRAANADDGGSGEDVDDGGSGSESGGSGEECEDDSEGGDGCEDDGEERKGVDGCEDDSEEHEDGGKADGEEHERGDGGGIGGEMEEVLDTGFMQM